MLFDTHCHLNDKTLLPNSDELIKRAKMNNVTFLNVVGYDLESSKIAAKLANRYDHVYASVGIHPTELLKMQENDFEEIEKLLADPKVIAVGEIGLDYYHDDSFKELQKTYFAKFIVLAHKYHKPIVIHVREALNDSYQILKQNAEFITTGVMHCYSGSAQMAMDFINLGLYIGLDGPLTFKNARVPKEVALTIPLDRLVLETDCPYLAPHPYRGKVNEPSYLPLIANEVATLRGISIEEVETITTNNAKRLFNL
jgi:TatD DNase family protein